MFKRPVDPRAMEQYKRQHPTAASRAGIATFPKMIPSTDGHPNADYISEIDRTLRDWDIPVLVMFSDKDIAFTVEEGQRIADMLPNGRLHVVHDAGHYLQEDAGEEIAERMVAVSTGRSEGGRHVKEQGLFTFASGRPQPAQPRSQSGHVRLAEQPLLHSDVGTRVGSLHVGQTADVAAAVVHSVEVPVGANPSPKRSRSRR